MAKILYPQVITEDLRPQGTGEVPSLFSPLPASQDARAPEVPGVFQSGRSRPGSLGYSWRQCQRWFASYRKGGIEELLKSRVHERGRQQLATPEAMEDLKQTMKAGRIAAHL